MRFLVHLHLYYHNQIDYFIEKLSNISDCDWDLFVTICEEDEISRQKILALKPDAKIIEVNNIGYDIWPFLQILKLVDLDQYDYVLKLHTKNYRKKVWWPKKYRYKGRHCNGYWWRNRLVSVLVGSKKTWQRNIKLLCNDPQIGMIADKGYFVSLEKNSMEDDLKNLDKYIEILNLSSRNDYFLAGTMFIAKMDIFKSLLNLNLVDSDFSTISQTNTSSSLAHCFERLFSLLVEEKKYKIFLRDDLVTILKEGLFYYFHIFL